MCARCLTTLLAVVVVIVTIVLMATLISNSSSNADNRPNFGFADQFNSSLGPRFSSVQWIEGDDAYSAFEQGNLVKYSLINATDANPGKRSVLALQAHIIDPTTNKTLDWTSYTISRDQKFVLFATQHKKVCQLSVQWLADRELLADCLSLSRFSCTVIRVSMSMLCLI